MKLYNFHSSSTSFRVRIALHLKKLSFDYLPLRLAWKDGEHDAPTYRALNPQANVPFLIDGEVRLAQSLAILEYLEERYPEPPLLPADPGGRARVRSLALHVACEIQPLNNLRVERYLADNLALDAETAKAWRRHWIGVGFDAIERMLEDEATGTFCHGDAPTLADCVVVPQVYNSLRPVVGIDLDRWPTLSRIYERCLAHPAFAAAHPREQPDFAELTGH